MCCVPAFGSEEPEGLRSDARAQGDANKGLWFIYDTMLGLWYYMMGLWFMVHIPHNGICWVSWSMYDVGVLSVYWAVDPYTIYLVGETVHMVRGHMFVANVVLGGCNGIWYVAAKCLCFHVS